jgi:hypothetical protein
MNAAISFFVGVCPVMASPAVFLKKILPVEVSGVSAPWIVDREDSAEETSSCSSFEEGRGVPSGVGVRLICSFEVGMFKIPLSF